MGWFEFGLTEKKQNSYVSFNVDLAQVYGGGYGTFAYVGESPFVRPSRNPLGGSTEECIRLQGEEVHFSNDSSGDSCPPGVGRPSQEQLCCLPCSP